MATIDGTKDDDVLNGTSDKDTINRFGANDILNGKGGNDTLGEDRACTHSPCKPRLCVIC